MAEYELQAHILKSPLDSALCSALYFALTCYILKSALDRVSIVCLDFVNPALHGASI